MREEVPPARPASVETVLLDAGGVLLDLDYPFLRRLLQARGRAATLDDLSRGEALARVEIQRRVRSGGKVREVWRDYFHILLGHAKVPGGLHEEIIDTLWEAHDRFGLWTVAIPGALSTVRQLREQGLRLGVVSNAEGQVERDLAAAGYEGLFHTVVDSALVGVEKPDPRIFEIALERIGGKPETCIFMGDVPAVDVEGARAADIAPVLLDRHDLYPDSDTPRLKSIEELPQWITRSSGEDSPV